MNKLILSFAVGSALACAGCSRGPDVASGPVSQQVDLAEVGDEVPAVQSTHSVATTQAVSATTVVEGGSAVPPRFPALLKTERTVVEGSGLSVAKVTSFIKTNKFDEFVSQLSSDSGVDPLAQDLTRAERERWVNRLGGQASLSQFACGLTVCAGSISLGANTALYDRIVDEYLKSGSHGGSLLDYRVNLGNGNFEQRFVMSVDPKVNGITFDGHPPVR